ncbi:glycosyltransferase family 4 protein [Mucilaginibacter daejeonensis]|uniref:glycosyltransferase family 4 protein n=1 Tax=Mucilaginibacter daejeonensis TaxID=398049 RepID=UPI001D170612|nr:glycosyltransferase family 4 protein [Mucilaginibacter daejeonensis]UEG51471.1 glycosyltransferase family 4 protein [Mucilaginibacter daejeonensis]
MNILLVNHKNPSSISSFSGTSFFMSRHINQLFENVTELDIIEYSDITRSSPMGSLKKSLLSYNRQLTAYLQRNTVNHDWIICQGGNAVVPYYTHEVPIVYWHDSTWHTYLQAYLTRQKFQDFKHNYPRFYLWDKRALERSDVIVFSSEFIADACIKNYKIPASKIEIVPFGANLLSAPDFEQVLRAIESKLQSEQLNLTFLGKDWERKGLRTAVLLTEKLNRIGIKASLNILGCDPRSSFIRRCPYVKMLGIIDKNREEDVYFLSQTLLNSHFLIHPAVAEPFGIALCEANAHGVPILSIAREGPQTIVREGQNGHLFAANSFLKKAMDTICMYKRDNDIYSKLCSSSWNEYTQRLNWMTNTLKLKEILLNRS